MRSLSFDRVKEVARSRGFEVLSPVYVTSKDRLQLRCLAKGHETEKTYLHIHGGQGCVKCWQERPRQTKEEVREAIRHWKQSSKGKESARRYSKSSSRKESSARYGKSAKGKEASRRYNTKPKNKLPIALRRRLWMAVRNGTKTGSAVRDLQCSIPELRTWIEHQWKPGMTWENWGRGPGTWQIDHLKPLASFDLTKREELLQACCFLNLQPLWHDEHARKTAAEQRVS